MNIPILTPHFIRRYERKVNTAIEAVAEESFRSVIQEEKALTIRESSEAEDALSAQSDT